MTDDPAGEVEREKWRALDRIHARAREMRGSFLNKVAAIERRLALLLTEYFCTEDEGKREIFLDYVVGKMSLEHKRAVLIQILKRDYPRFWDGDAKKWVDELQEVQEFRNKLAHSTVDVSEDALKRSADQGVGFILWKQGAPITEKEFNDWEVRANMIVGILQSTKRLIPFKEIPLK